MVAVQQIKRLSVLSYELERAKRHSTLQITGAKDEVRKAHLFFNAAFFTLDNQILFLLLSQIKRLHKAVESKPPRK